MAEKRFKSLADSLKKQGEELIARRREAEAAQQAAREGTVAALAKWERDLVAPVMADLKASLQLTGDLLAEGDKHVESQHFLMTYTIKYTWSDRGTTIMLMGKYPASFTVRVSRTGSDAREFKRELPFNCTQDRFADTLEEGIREMVLGNELTPDA